MSLKDTSNSTNKFANFLPVTDPRAVKAVVKGVPQDIDLQVGKLVIKAGETMFGSLITIDGVNLPVKSLTLRGDVVKTSGVWIVEVEFYPGLIGEKKD